MEGRGADSISSAHDPRADLRVSMNVHVPLPRSAASPPKNGARRVMRMKKEKDAYIGWSRSRPRPSSLASFWELWFHMSAAMSCVLGGTLLGLVSDAGECVRTHDCGSAGGALLE